MYVCVCVYRYEMGDFFNWHEDALPLEEVEGTVANGGVYLSVSICVYLCLSCMYVCMYVRICICIYTYLEERKDRGDKDVTALS
jgi:hypothetical protein